MFLAAAAPVLAVDKEVLQIARDLAQLQQEVRAMQRSLDKDLAETKLLLNQNLEAAKALAINLAVLEKVMQAQEKILVAPVANLNTRVDTLASQFQSLRESVEEMSAKLSKVQQQVVDIKNIVSTVPPPAPVPAAPPPQVQAEALYKNALRDFQSGNFNLAGPQFTEYVKLFGHTELAADAQYYLGEMFYQQKDYDQAAEAFQRVLERFPAATRASDAQYKKGLSLLKQGQRDGAAREFREVIARFPRTPAADQASEALRGLGLRPPPAAPPKSPKTRVIR